MVKLRIAVDGPAGSGKSTLSKLLAKKLGYKYINTGIMYRLLAYIFNEKQINLDDKTVLQKFLGNLRLDFLFEGEEFSINYEGRPVKEELLKTLEIGTLASLISQKSLIREFLTELQKKLAQERGIVIEGRDIGTVIMPGADFKFFITASPDERGKRRFLELAEKGENVDLSEVIESIRKRDEQDRNREIAPLKKAKDAYLIDTTGLSIEESLNNLLLILRKKK